jgi:hypothetical protein
VSIIVERATDIIFEAVELSDGSGRYVCFTRAAMLPQHTGEFKTEAEVPE